MKVYLITSSSLGLSGQWIGNPIAVYADKQEAEQKVQELNYIYDSYFTLKEMELK